MSVMMLGCQKETIEPLIPDTPTHEILFTVSLGANMAYGVNGLNEFNYLYVPFKKTLTIKEYDTLFIKVELGSEWIITEIFQIRDKPPYDTVWRQRSGGKGYFTTFVVKPIIESGDSLSKNIMIGYKHLKDTIRIKLCKHGADWNHPGCDTKVV